MNWIKKLFRPGEAAPKDDRGEVSEKEEQKSSGTVVSVTEDNPDPAQFVEFIVGCLVSNPQAVKTEMSYSSDEEAEIIISCEQSDIGRIIGKKGRTISAIRSLAADAAGRLGIKNLKVELQD